MIFWDIKEPDGNYKTIMKPVRLVLNNFTISFFENSNFESNILTLEIEKTNIFKSKNHPWCALLKQNRREMEFCPFSMDRNDKTFMEEWSYDFKLFKNQCHVERATNEIEDEIKYKMKTKVV